MILHNVVMSQQLFLEIIPSCQTAQSHMHQLSWIIQVKQVEACQVLQTQFSNYAAHVEHCSVQIYLLATVIITQIG